MSITEILKSSNKDFRKNLLFLFVSYFLVLFNYPLIRASTTAIFFEAYGAKSSPHAWAWSILFLSISIFICNRIQKHARAQLVFGIASLFSAGVFLSGELSVFAGNKLFAYAAFIWKEICIVIQVHLILAFANVYFPKEMFKRLVGPVGATGSLGGILGGLLTSHLSKDGGTITVLMVGVAFVVLPILTFMFTSKVSSEQQEKPKSPVASLDTPDVRKYVLHICIIVALTQFIINIADFKFNLAFEAAVPTSDQRTGYLGEIYTWTNSLTFIFQFLLMPLILPRVTEKKLHLFIPLSYLIGILVLVQSAYLGLMPIAVVYIYFKASDYSFFSAAKEMLYQPLGTAQKYGAKYLTDMLVYRSSKALIALVLIYLQSALILDMMMVGLCFVWIFVVTRLFRLHRKLFA
jgi:AAA family ATP:ADP antiporter